MWGKSLIFSVIRYEMMITNPHIIMPVHSTSKEVLVIDLGQITLCNTFEMVNKGNKQRGLISVF